MQSVLCHDCDKQVACGDSCYLYKIGEQEVYKCADCYSTDSKLRNFRETEVYSRVVGFLRPVKQWNKGKSSEFADRNEYDNTK